MGSLKCMVNLEAEEVEEAGVEAIQADQVHQVVQAASVAPEDPVVKGFHLDTDHQVVSVVVPVLMQVQVHLAVQEVLAVQEDSVDQELPEDPVVSVDVLVNQEVQESIMEVGQEYRVNQEDSSLVRVFQIKAGFQVKGALMDKGIIILETMVGTQVDTLLRQVIQGDMSIQVRPDFQDILVDSQMVKLPDNLRSIHL